MNSLTSDYHSAAKKPGVGRCWDGPRGSKQLREVERARRKMSSNISFIFKIMSCKRWENWNDLPVYTKTRFYILGTHLSLVFCVKRLWGDNFRFLNNNRRNVRNQTDNPKSVPVRSSEK